MTLKDQIASDVGTVFLNTDEFAETVTYNPDGESPVDISAVFRYQGIEEQYVRQGEQAYGLGTVACNPTDVTAPSLDDTFTIDSIIWAVRSILYKEPFVTFEVVTRDDRFIGGNKERIHR